MTKGIIMMTNKHIDFIKWENIIGPKGHEANGAIGSLFSN
jgi:hypothetical protein